MRKHYLDNIRWATVLLVLAYHVCYLFNGVGVFGAVPGAKNIPLFDYFACAVYPWFMVLLFVIAGISARYALRGQTGKTFLKKRAVKLLVPSTLGPFVFHWVTGYLNIKMGGGLDAIPAALLYPISVVSGFGPLWFIQMLFLFSCLLVLLRKIDKADRIWTLCGKVNLPVILLLFVPIFAGAQVLNMPVLTTYRFGIYFVSFLIGYYIFSHDEAQEITGRIHLPMLFLAALGAVVYMAIYGGTDFTSPVCLQSLMTNLYLWIVVLAILGCGKRYFDWETAFTRYMTKSSFGIYILHYPILTVVCYSLSAFFDLPAIWNYVTALVLVLVLTFTAFEILKRIPVVRFLVLGINPEKSPDRS
ncbi:acyltransferase [uncultured Dysosmobacter sp.]|uniref:acyltransferase family protein n=1 Tax=uncultured Dysosmobacter sp. TaxID=2591384 RepID=UPI00262446F4|nr:acyltransferase [uncultured Dysosmobacter sp.]